MKKKKKLLILINDLNFFCSHRLPIAEKSKKNGFDVVIGYGELGGADHQLLEQKGFRLCYIPMKRGGLSFFKDIILFFNIWKFLKREKPDILHLVTIKPYLYGGIASRLTNIPSVVSAISGLGTLFVHRNLKSKLLLILLSPIYYLAFNHFNQKIIVQNEDDAKVLVNMRVLNPQKVELIKGSGVKLQNFTNHVEPSGIPVICFVGRLLYDKGVCEFIHAARLIKKKGIKAKFLLVGDLDNKNLTSLNINDLNKIKNENYVEIVGYKKNISSLFANSNIICLPSYREGLPKSLMEAAAASRAVVTTDVPGCRDAIIPNKTGLLVPVKNSQKLADAVQWLIEHPLERFAMGKEGRKLAEKEFDIEIIVQHHLDIYRKLNENLKT